MNCLGCRIRDKRAITDPYIAFLAGLGFVMSHNNEAVLRSLCDECQVQLRLRIEHTDKAIARADRRERTS